MPARRELTMRQLRQMLRLGRASEDAKGNGLPTRQLVHRSPASARDQTKACRPGALSGRDVQRGLRRSHSQAL
jgi:hypothetical protein